MQQEGFAVPGDAGGGFLLLSGWFLRKDLYLHAPPASPVRFGVSFSARIEKRSAERAHFSTEDY